MLKSYAKQVPENFQWVSKVWERITIPKFPRYARYGNLQGQINQDFLNAELFKGAVLKCFEPESVKSHTGPFVFQFPHIAKELVSTSEFINKLGDFLESLPNEFMYAIEIRNKDFLVSSFFETLNQFKVAHCFNHWSYMPDLKSQMKAAANAGGLSAEFYVARILTPLGVSYQQAVEKFKPYDTLKQPLEDMRADVVKLAKRALETNRTAYIIVNNRAEGNAPLTIESIGTAICEQV